MIAASEVLCQDMSFIQHPVDLTFQGIQCIKVFDLDRDGDLDIVGGSEITPNAASQGLAWWRNDGGNPVKWTKYVIDQSFVHVMSVDVADIDGDRNMDIVATSWALHEVSWWKNSGNPTTDWRKSVVVAGFTNAHDARCADLNHDGATDIVAVSSTPGKIAVFYNNEEGTGSSWTQSVVSTAFSGAKMVSLVDLDEDGDLDIVGIADGANEIARWENLSGEPVVWKKNVIASGFVGGASVDVVDLKPERKYAIVATSWKTNQVASWTGSQNNGWEQKTVSNRLGIAANALGFDSDRDGDVDIVAAGIDPGQLLIYENTKSDWAENVLTDNFSGGCALAVADIDGDGDCDIIAGAAFIGVLCWWEDVTPIATGLEIPLTKPATFGLKQNYPNPFNPTTTIQFSLPQERPVVITLNDILGKEIRTIADRRYPAGEHSIIIDGSDLASGIYLCRFQSGSSVETARMALIR